MSRPAPTAVSGDLIVQNTAVVVTNVVLAVLSFIIGTATAVAVAIFAKQLSQAAGPWVMIALLAISVFLVLRGVLFWLAYRAQSPGIVVSPGRNLLEFPGSGLAATSASDYVSWHWLTRSYRRFDAPLDEIISIDNGAVSSISLVDAISTSPYLAMSVTLPFGVVSFKFGNEAQRDRLFSVLRTVNQMGTPVFKA